MKKHRAVRAASLIVLAALGGCVAVPYDQAYYPAAYPAYGPPVYAAPAPVYTGPPVYFGFNYLYRGGGGHHHHGWGHRH